MEFKTRVKVLKNIIQSIVETEKPSGGSSFTHLTRNLMQAPTSLAQLIESDKKPERNKVIEELESIASDNLNLLTNYLSLFHHHRNYAHTELHGNRDEKEVIYPDLESLDLENAKKLGYESLAEAYIKISRQRLTT